MLGGEHGTMLTIEGEAKTKQRNYGDKVNLANGLAVLDQSNSVFMVVLKIVLAVFCSF